MSPDSDGRAHVRLPPWLFGNDVLGFAREARLKAHAVDMPTYWWDLETLERYEHRSRPRLFEVERVAGGTGAPAWGVLANLQSLSPAISPAMLATAREEILGGAEANSITRFASWVKFSTVSASNNELVAAVEANYQSFCAIGAEGGELAFPDVAVAFVRADKALAGRATLARVLMRIEEEPELLENRPIPTAGRTVFGSGWHLQSDLGYTRDAYLGPLFLCLSPWVWAFAQARISGSVVYNLGTAFVGRLGEASELIQLFLPPGTTESTLRPEIGPADSAATLAWWVEHLDQLFGLITDPASYVDANGDFRPRRQFEVLLSIEQLGRRIVSILANDRDLSARRLLGFAALDTLEGLGIISLDEACRLTRAQRALESLEGQLPETVARMLLPTARRAVEALRTCQNGFYLSSRIGTSGVRFPDGRGGERTVPLDEAVSLYLRVLRNANHGFTGRNDTQRRRDEILLMAHDGDIPGEVALLPYLYWLTTLADPEPLRRQLRRLG
jgi:hypothetical protein